MAGPITPVTTTRACCICHARLSGAVQREVERADRRRLRNLGTLWYGLFGSLYASDTGVMPVFRACRR